MRKFTIICLYLSIVSTLLIKAQEPQYTIEAIPYGNTILLANKGTKEITKIDPEGKVLSTYKFDAPITGMSVVGSTAFVTTGVEKGELQMIDIENSSLIKKITTGMGACSPTLSPDNKTIYILNRYKGTISRIDIEKWEITGEVVALREPCAAAITPNGRYMLVNNFLPAQRADLDFVGSDVTVISLANFEVEKHIKLDNGSNALRGISITPNGKYAYISHNLGRFQVPTSQLQQGWMNTNAISVIDINNLQFSGSLLLDEPDRGAAGIWGIACDEDYIYVTHSGTHDMSVIDHKKAIERFEAYEKKSNLSYDLHFMYDLRKRVPLRGNGPRNLTLSNGKLYVPTYFADTLNVIDGKTLEITTIAQNPNRSESRPQMGERIFNDASFCYQNWQSCNGCHPGEARTDGMNWDLMNDGIGNPKNCKSLLLSHVTPANMISGIRENAEIAVHAGFKFIQFCDIDKEQLYTVDEYLKSLRPLPSPFLVNGQLNEKAKKGRKIFEKYKCDQCHSGQYYTDMKMYRIGQDIEFEKGWDTPTLIEVWRTAPYLFDGRAATLKDVFTIHKHGIEKKISDKEADELSEYVNSL